MIIVFDQVAARDTRARTDVIAINKNTELPANAPVNVTATAAAARDNDDYDAFKKLLQNIVYAIASNYGRGLRQEITATFAEVFNHIAASTLTQQQKLTLISQPYHRFVEGEMAPLGLIITKLRLVLPPIYFTIINTAQLSENHVMANHCMENHDMASQLFQQDELTQSSTLKLMADFIFDHLVALTMNLNENTATSKPAVMMFLQAIDSNAFPQLMQLACSDNSEAIAVRHLVERYMMQSRPNDTHWPLLKKMATPGELLSCYCDASRHSQLPTSVMRIIVNATYSAAIKALHARENAPAREQLQTLRSQQPPNYHFDQIVIAPTLVRDLTMCH